MNHKFFWNFLLYSFLGTAHVACCLFLNKDNMAQLQKDIVYMVAAVLSFAFSISIGFLFAIHTYIISKNMSTVEMGAIV